MTKYLLPLVFVFMVSGLNAQTSAPEKSSHYKAAEETLESMGLEKVTEDVTSHMLDMQIKSNPMLESKRSIMQAFFKKYMSWTALKEEYIKIYLSEFTESELKDMTAFYRTPTGKKLAEKSAVLTVKGSKMGQDKVQGHLAELQEMLMKD